VGPCFLSCLCLQVVPLFSWGKFADYDYTKLLRDLRKSGALFGKLDIQRVPRELARRLRQQDLDLRPPDLLANLFLMFDHDSDGVLNATEIVNGMERLGR
jgi:hypothetical protein